MSALSQSELNTLLAMATACESGVDAADTINLYTLLDERLKPQLRQALKALPGKTRSLLRNAATPQKSEGRVAA